MGVITFLSRTLGPCSVVECSIAVSDWTVPKVLVAKGVASGLSVEIVSCLSHKLECCFRAVY